VAKLTQRTGQPWIEVRFDVEGASRHWSANAVRWFYRKREIVQDGNAFTWVRYLDGASVMSRPSLDRLCDAIDIAIEAEKRSASARRFDYMQPLRRR